MTAVTMTLRLVWLVTLLPCCLYSGHVVSNGKIHVGVMI